MKKEEDIRIDMEFYPNGNIMSEIPRNNKNGQYHGIKKKYYSNGKLCREFPYKNDKVHGLVKWWHDNGQTWSENSYKNNINHGVGIEFYI